MQLGEIGRTAAVVVLASGVMAAPAGAAILVATYTGKIQSGFDSSGLFGAHSSGLTGLAATMTFTFDTETPGADQQDVPTFSGLSSSGSPAAGTATITIKGRSASIVGVTGSSAHRTNNASFPTGEIDQVMHVVYAPDLGRGWEGRNANRMSASVQGGPDMFDQPSYLAPLEYDVTRANLTTGSFVFLQHVPDVPTIIDVWAYGTVYWDHVSISVAGLPGPGGVPEPTSWALMIGGLGAVGGVLRRRRPRPQGDIGPHAA